MNYKALIFVSVVSVAAPSIAAADDDNDKKRPKSSLSTLDCRNYLGQIFRDFAATKCSGWWVGNENKGAIPGLEVKSALELLGLVNPAYIEKLEFGDDDDRDDNDRDDDDRDRKDRDRKDRDGKHRDDDRDDDDDDDEDDDYGYDDDDDDYSYGDDDDDFNRQLAIDFDTPLYGLTVVGIHWGGGVFKHIDGAPKGLGTAFFVFDAEDGLDKIFMSHRWSQSVSNAALYRTGQPCVGNDCGGGGIVDAVVPEPSTYALMGAGLAALGVIARRRRRREP